MGRSTVPTGLNAGRQVASEVSDSARRRAAAMAEGRRSYQRRRSALLAAAAKVFREKGFRGATLNDVATELGTERGSLYYYVSGKEELFHEVVKDAAADTVCRLEEISQAPGKPRDRLRGAICALMAAYAGHYPFLYVYIAEDMSQALGADSPWAQDMLSLDRRYTATFTRLIQEGFDDGSMRSSAPAQVAACGIIGMVSWSHRWYRQAGALSAEQIADAYADMVLDGITMPRRRKHA